MTDLTQPRSTVSNISLDDKWTLDRGRVVISGTQAIARVLLAQSALDRRDGLRTAGFVSGYRGSPLGTLDATLWSIGDRLSAVDIVFQPGVNEDLAATAVRGTQQIEAVPGAKFAGVFAAWYGKGPGVDRSCDALKHGNYTGTHPRGGVLVFYGDDHAGKSSTVAHQSEQALAASLIPSLYPSNVQELIDFGLLGYALSRYSGSWVGIKCINEVAEQTATVALDLESLAWNYPAVPLQTPNTLHTHVGPLDPVADERVVLEHRLPLVQAFVRANNIDRSIFRASEPKLGLVAAGKSYADVRAALAILGLDGETAAAAGISLYKVGCIWPLEPQGLQAFAHEHAMLFVIEEKKSFIEQQLAALLINTVDRPLLVGKQDEFGQSLLSSSLSLDGFTIARAILRCLKSVGIRLRSTFAEALVESAPAPPTTLRDASQVGTPKRMPFFCSGCPHNRSTKIPDGSLSMTGIGCHTMVNFVRSREALLPTQMGGEGANWLGLAPFTNTRHIFQNMGDGTYFHSGLLAIRAAVAARVNITYKILYNDAVAMTGGQPVDGPISVARIAQQVRHEGVERIVVLSDDPARHRGNRDFPADVRIAHRDTLDDVQRELRDTPGCTVLIYEQTCAAEKRRRRKRGKYPDPPKRLFISKAVCEGCGDCSVQSTCVSLVPVDTPFGRKRAVDQSSCNKDFSCLNGFCPSFITVYGAEPRKRHTNLKDEDFTSLPEPAKARVSGESFNVMIAGVGGTGVVTVGALLGMAAHIDGLALSVFDMTGLAQKNGAVYSHLRIARSTETLHAQRIGRAEADTLLAFDPIAALGLESTATLSTTRTRLAVNAAVTPTAAFQFDRDLSVDSTLLLSRLSEMTRNGAVVVDASAIALAIFGDTVAANLFLVGVALQHGMLPISSSSIEQAIILNGVATSLNQRAFRLGRLFVSEPARVTKLVSPPSQSQGKSPPASLSETIAHRSKHLTRYQNDDLAMRYQRLIETVRQAEQATVPGSTALALAVARNYAKLLAYKDEYEVARLLTDPALAAEIAEVFGDGGRIALNLAPPFLGGRCVDGRPKKREFSARILPWMRLLAHLRFLRGTVFDPFARTDERRMERALIVEYEALVSEVLTTLSSANHTQAVELVGLAEQIRGYGPIKAEAASAYRNRVHAALRAYHAIPLTPLQQGKLRRRL